MNRYLRVKLLDRIEVRPFAPRDALAVADLLYKCFGYTYRGRSFGAYDPDEIAALQERGELSGIVAVLPDGRVAGYLGMKRHGRDAVEVVQGLVDPECRHAEIVHRLSDATYEEVKRIGARKIVVATVTFHPYAQRTQEHLGIMPCYLAVGEHPLPLGFRGMGGETVTQRETFVVASLVMSPARLAVYLPRRHAAMIGRLYEGLGLTREDRAAAAEPGALPELSARGEFDIDLRENWQSARIRVIAPGADTLPAIDRMVDDFRGGFIEHVEARVPLDGPHAPALVAGLEERGFFFSGIDPEEEGRDEVVLTRLLGTRIDFGRVKLSHPLAQALGEYVARCLPPASAETDVFKAGGGHTQPAAAPAPPPVPPLEMIEFARLAGAKQLVSGLAHEVNNPLNVILGSTYYLRQRLRDGTPANGGAPRGAVRADEVLERLASIEEEVRRVAKVLDGLRRFAHPEAMPRTLLDVGRPIADALSLLGSEIRNSAIEIRTVVPEGLPPVKGNAAEIEQVLYQLVRNAFEASQPGGSIEIEAREEGETLRIEVRDRGRGIAPEDQRRVFDPFFTSKEGSIGAGLGLPIARAIVESHGGRLRLASRPGEGTAATVELPISRDLVEATERR